MRWPLLLYTFGSHAWLSKALSSAPITSKRGLSSSSLSSSSSGRIAVLGGGASGVFAAIAAAEHPASKHVTILEATGRVLNKVKISGGGRCNVMHDTTKTTPTILAGYPRGSKELNGLFHKRFSPTMAQEWFECRGVQLKTEEDGRMFPITDNSETIMNALLDSANDSGVEIRYRQKVTQLSRNEDDGRFHILFQDGDNKDKDEEEEVFDAVILATGSSPTGYKLAQSLGHEIVRPVPSLFTLNCKHDLGEDGGFLYGLSGLSVPYARASISKRQFQEGPLLITHHGLSGPAVLRLSAFAARELKETNYRSELTVNWDTQLGHNPEQLLEILCKIGTVKPKRKIMSACPLRNNSIPRRLWASLCQKSGFTEEATWGSAKKVLLRKLANNVLACKIQTTGKGTFKEEFVTAGGVDLKEVDMTTMSSKVCEGLYACGEVINVDGITGGYNFMNCWGTGFVAGNAAAEYSNTPVQVQDAEKKVA